MTDRAFSHPNLGHEIRVEQDRREVRLVFVCHSAMQADDLAENLLRQLQEGAVHFTIMGKPSSITES